MNKHSKLCLEERQRLYVWRRKGWKKRAIARRLGRHPSTILRELERNRHPLPKLWREMSPYEQAKYAHDKAAKRRRESRRRQRLKTHELRCHVIQKLVDEQWSPEQIAETLGEHIPGVRISTKSIYNFTRYERRELRKYLRRRGKAYRQRVAHRRSRFRNPAPDKKRLDQRSKEANERLEFGHWEIDTIHSNKKSSCAILTLRERKSRQRFFFLLPNLKAESVLAVLKPFFKALPEHMRKTLTSDNGSEFSVSELLKVREIREGIRTILLQSLLCLAKGFR